MVATQETLDELEDIGLNMYERKIYSALLARGVSTAGQLSEMTDVPRSRAYDVLESLADKGFTVIKSSQPMEYVSIPPQQAVENIKQRKKSEIEDEIKKLDKFKESEAVDELESLYDQGVELVEPEEMSGSLKGSHQVAQHLGTMFQEAEEQIKLMTTEEGLIDITDDHSDTLEEASKNDVEVKLMAPLTDRNREHKQEVEDFAQFKDLDPDHDSGRPEGEFAIVDGEASTLSLTPDEVHSTQETAFWTESDHVASNTMEPLFDTVWHSSN